MSILVDNRRKFQQKTEYARISHLFRTSRTGLKNNGGGTNIALPKRTRRSQTLGITTGYGDTRQSGNISIEIRSKFIDLERKFLQNESDNQS